MRVLMLHNRYLLPGGEDKSTEAEVELLREHGHEVVLHEETNERVGELGRLRTALRATWSFESRAIVRRLIREHRPDIVHVQNFFPLLSPSVYYAAAAENVPVVQTVRNFRLFCPGAYLLRDDDVCEDCLRRYLPWPGIVRGCYRHSRAGSSAVALMIVFHRLAGTWRKKVTTYVALTSFSRQKLIEGGIPPSKIAIRPNFLLTDPGAGDGRGGYALFVGRLSPEKGIRTLLAAWRTAGADAELAIAGGGPFPQDAAAAGMAGVKHLGPKSSSEVFALLQKAAFLVMPSIWYENMPRTIIEAFACGTPVIASRLGAMAEMIEDGKTGLLFAPGNVADLAEKIRWALGRGPEMREMGIRARREYEAKYTADKNHDLLVELYRKAMEQRDAG